jgi:phage shock protein PspC (stress-responsive transcriptional regulator)
MGRPSRPTYAGRMTTTLARPRKGRWIAGVCAGIARRYGLDPKVVRIAFLLSCLLPGPQFIAYVVLWMLIPEGD